MPTCYANLSGRLGNQMFEIANGYAHCMRNGYELVLPRHGSTHWNTYLHNFRNCITRTVPPTDAVKWKQPSFAYSTVPANAQYLEGYVQSSKFFADVSGEIRDAFQPAPAIQTYVREKYGGLIQRRDSAIVIHVRRGDYFSVAKHHSIHGILTDVYYKRAIAAALEAVPGAELIVFSDDVRWCRMQSWLNGATIVDERNDCVALFLMTQFRNFIISNSTYSWWGAWLSGADARVWAPATWFGPNGPQDYEDVYEPTWIRIPIA